MTPEDEAEIVALMRAARAKDRGYANYFGWSLDRDLEELHVAALFAESLENDGSLFFSQLRSRCRPNDPPDCEALLRDGARIAIEITELVDEAAIRAYKAGAQYDWAEWGKTKFVRGISRAIAAKDARFPHLKGGPYEGGYVVIIHTDEPVLSFDVVTEYLSGHQFPTPKHIKRAFLLFGYDPKVERCRHVEIPFDA
jgi:hypothetical protein